MRNSVGPAEVEDAVAEVERAGAAAYLKDALSVLLEVRPVDPLLFLAAYFRHAAEPEDPAGLAWHLIRACPRSRPCFHDNLYIAFSSLRQQASGQGASEESVPAARRQSAEDAVPAAEYTALLEHICCDLPPEVATSLMADLRPGARPVRFPEFVAAVESCLATLEAAQCTARLWDACDDNKLGSMPRDDFLARLEMWRQLHRQGLSFEGEAPPTEALRARLAARRFMPEDAVGPRDLFAVMWAYWREETGIG